MHVCVFFSHRDSYLIIDYPQIIELADQFDDRMDYKSLGRHHRSEGANIKQALQLMLPLVVCAWLLYQINHSRDQTHRFDGQIKLFEEYGVVLLGRKGNQIALPNSAFVHSVVEAENTTNGTDQKKQENEKYHKMLVMINNSPSVSDDKEEEVQVRGPLNDVQIRDMAKKDEVHSFRDENGVPHEGNETERIGHISSFTFSEETRLGEVNIYEVTVTSGKANDAEINSESITHADTSGIIYHNSETGAGDSLVL